jgi:hypothetical protein
LIGKRVVARFTESAMLSNLRPLWKIADMCAAKSHVGFTPESGRESGFPQQVLSALPPKADVRGAKSNVRFGPIADSCSAANRVAIRAFAVVRHSGVACVLQAKFDHW